MGAGAGGEKGGGSGFWGGATWIRARPSAGRPPKKKMPSAAATRRRPAKTSVLQRFIDELLEGPLDTLAFRRRLLKQREEHVLLGVDQHIAAAGAVPDKKSFAELQDSAPGNDVK